MSAWKIGCGIASGWVLFAGSVSGRGTDIVVETNDTSGWYSNYRVGETTATYPCISSDRGSMHSKITAAITPSDARHTPLQNPHDLKVHFTRSVVAVLAKINEIPCITGVMKMKIISGRDSRHLRRSELRRWPARLTAATVGLFSRPLESEQVVERS